MNSDPPTPPPSEGSLDALLSCTMSDSSVTGGELFEDIVAREYYSEADAR